MTGPWSDLDRPPLDAAALRAALAGPDGPLARVEVLPEVGSTNAELVARATADPAGWPAPALLTTDSQVAGRGRLGRTWTAPPRSGVAMSLLLRPAAPPASWSWLPLLAGLAVVDAVRDVAGVPAQLKWPNDVLVGDRKVCGLLVEVVPGPGGSGGGLAGGLAGGPAGVVVGVGLNTSTRREELPVPSATSLALEGARTTDRGVLVRALVRSLLAEVERFEAADGSATASGLAARVTAACSTLGSAIEVALPGGRVLRGTAEGLDDDGRLLVRSGGSEGTAGGPGELEAVAAGDVVHVR